LYCKVDYNTGRLKSKKLKTSAVYADNVARTHGAKVDKNEGHQSKNKSHPSRNESHLRQVRHPSGR
jgi:hypothetical protein